MKPSAAYKLAGWILSFVTVVVAVYLWFGRINSERLTTPGGKIYYPALADAFLAGQLHLKIAPDPRLKTLERPWHVVPDGIPRLAESTYFDGRYYLYFSPVPALVLFIPFHWTFGVYPTDHFAVFLFTLGAWAAGTVVLAWAWRRWFHYRSPAWLALGGLMLGFCTRSILLLEHPSVHAVPVSCAAFFLMLALVGVAWTLDQPTGTRRHGGLALVSLLWAGAVACRPNYLFGLPALGVLWVHLWRSHLHQTQRSLAAGLRLGASAAGPAAIVGLGLMAYNYSRFGRFTEFGLSQQVGTIDQIGMQVFSLTNLSVNWRGFFLSFPNDPVITAYFPFFRGWLDYWGILYATPLLAIVVAMPWLLWRTSWRADGAWRTLILTLSGMFLLNSLSLLLLKLLLGPVERYVVDILPVGTLLSFLIWLAVLDVLRDRPGRALIRLFRTGLAVAGAAGLISSGISIMMRADPVERLPALARASNALVAAMEEWRGVRYGPMTLRLRFHDFKVGRREPLLVSGNGRDIVYVDYLAPDQIQLGLDHRDSVNLETDPILIEPGREYHLDFDLGFLYPPPEHPFFAGFPETAAKALRHRLQIGFGGTTRLNLGCDYYPTHPGDIFVGHGGPQFPGRFSGTIVATARHGLPKLETVATPRLRQHVRMTAQFPRFRSHHSEPLLSWGHARAGDLLYVTYVGPDKLRLGHDAYGYGAFDSEVLSYTPDTPVVLDFELPPLRADFDATKPALLLARFADRLAIATPRFLRPTEAYEIFAGYNGIASSVSQPLFQGRILKLESFDAPMFAAFAQIEQGHGPVHLFLRLPPFTGDRREPLLVTGVTGAADALYIQYVDDRHIRVGYDHWGQGGPVSPPVFVDYNAIQFMELSLGSLYPSAADPAWGDTPGPARIAAARQVSVRINQATALETEAVCYPANANQIRIGRNPVGLSTCDPTFSGVVFGAERLPLGSPAGDSPTSP